MADYVVHRIVHRTASRLGIFEVGGKRHLFGQDFDRAKDAFDFLRAKYDDRKVSVSKCHAKWLVFLT